MAKDSSDNVSKFYPENELTTSNEPHTHLTLNDIAQIPAKVSAELGRCRMKIREVLSLDKGSIVALNKQAGELGDVYVNGVLIGRGEMIVLADTLHIRIVEIEGFEKDEE
ncbi:MAG: FliM/FliN family flagellar motor switch protein [Candidatus Hydrogenedentes bacterium]|nr:FliM/FliN family flagellar motor switch protein [Candidatus Hydrogenedentota bacterium]